MDMTPLWSCKPVTFYRYYCNTCGRKGLTANKHFTCHEGKTRITLAEVEE